MSVFGYGRLNNTTSQNLEEVKLPWFRKTWVQIIAVTTVLALVAALVAVLVLYVPIQSGNIIPSYFTFIYVLLTKIILDIL